MSAHCWERRERTHGALDCLMSGSSTSRPTLANNDLLQYSKLPSHLLLLISRLVFVASAALISFWLLYGGTELYRNDAYYKQPFGANSLPAVYGCKNALFAPVCSQQQMLYNQLLLLWLPSGLLILSAAATLVLTPLSNNSQQLPTTKSARNTLHIMLQRWLGSLVSPRFVGLQC
jgi:hypothetical protein